MVEPTLAQLWEIHGRIDELDTRTLNFLLHEQWEKDKKVSTLEYWLKTAERAEDLIEILRDPARSRWK